MTQSVYWLHVRQNGMELGRGHPFGGVNVDPIRNVMIGLIALSVICLVAFGAHVFLQ